VSARARTAAGQIDRPGRRRGCPKRFAAEYG